MLIFRSVLLTLACLLFAVGCSKKDSGSSSLSSSSLLMQMPGRSLHGDLSSLSGTACFAINISGSGLPSQPANTCDPAYGQMTKLIAPGQSVEIETEQGSNRKLEMLYVISDIPCEQYDGSQPLGERFGSNRVFRLGYKEGLNFDKDEVVVNLEIEYPAPSNSFKNLYSFSASCDKAGDSINIMARKQARVVLGASRGMTSGGQLMHVRVLDQKIDITKPSDFAGKIMPNRLGEEQ